MTNQISIQDVLFFPQMKPEKVAQKDDISKYTEKGIPQEWAEVMQQLGYVTLSKIQETKHTKLHQELCGYNKKNQLGYTNPAMDAVQEWCK
jgi:lysyl-tRNA synthetase class 2